MQESFGKYILLEKLATGGMAEVYLAKNPGIGISKFVAIKRILPQYSENENFIEMFKGEAKIAVNLSHGNVVSIHEFGVERNQFFIVMDYVEGRNLRQILNKLKKAESQFSIEQVVYIIKEVAAGLDHAHRCLDGSTGKPLNLIHRDMSPQNVMTSFEGEVKVVDFGIAKAETQLETTRAGELKGKFGYMSPEQAEGQPVDLRTDVFSLGIVLWEMLANDRLFIANNEINTLRKIRECHVPSLRKINPDVPQELERIVNMSLAKDRNLRYQTAASFHRELNRFLNRQFPDFSPHDFAVFIKTLFAAEILENRKRLIEYAAVEAKPSISPSAAIAQAAIPSPPGADRYTMTRTEDDAPSMPSVAHELGAKPDPHAPDSANAGTHVTPPPPPGRRAPAASSTPPPPPIDLEAETRMAKRPGAKPNEDAAGRLNADAARLESEARAKAAAAAEAKARAKAKSDADAANARARAKADSDARPSAPPRSKAPSLRAEELHLSVDTGSWQRGRRPDETFVSGSHYGYTTSGRYLRGRAPQPKSRSTFGTAALAIVGLLLASAATWALVDNRGFKDSAERAIAFAKRLSEPARDGDPSPAPREGETSVASTCVKVPIKITSAPVSGAPVWADGALLPDATPTDTYLCEGEHEIRVHLPGYAEVNRRMNLVKGTPAVFAANLKAERVAKLDVEVVGGTADIYVDSQKIGESTTGVLGHEVMADREHVVKATKHNEPKAVIQEAKLTIREQQTGRVVFRIPFRR